MRLQLCLAFANATPPPPLQSYQMPTGHTPRAMNIYARGHSTRQANPGDEVTITGAFLPAVEGGWRQLRSGLLASTFLEAFEVVQEKATGGAGEGDEEFAEEVMEINQGVCNCVVPRSLPLPYVRGPNSHNVGYSQKYESIAF